MIVFRCPTCQTVQKAEDSAAGVRIPCSQCHQLLEIPATAKTAMVAQHLGAAPAVPTREPEDRPWHCTVFGERRGPMSEREVYKLIDRGDLAPTDLVWRSGWPDWKEADGSFDFADELPRRRRRRRDDDYDREKPDDTGALVCGILSIVCGLIAFVFCPPLFGVIGIILGGVSLGIGHDKTIGTIGLVLSIAGLIGGMIIGVLVVTSLGQF